MLELFHHGSSVCAAKVRFALEEKQLPWQGHYLDILAGEQFTPEYLKINPRAMVPTLRHGGRIVIESTVICEYLEQVFPQNQKAIIFLCNHFHHYYISQLICSLLQ